MTHKEKVLALLSDGRPHTHHELYALGCIAHSRITNLRNDGHVIECWRDGDFYMYRLASSLEEAASLSPRRDDGDVRAWDTGAASSSEAVLAAASPPGTPASLPLSLFDMEVTA